MRRLLLVLPVALAACGGSMSRLDTAQIQSFNTTAQGISAAVATYGNQAAVMTSPETCAAAQSAYDATVRPMVGQMQGMGASMDAMMDSMGHMDADDMGCGAAAMMAELDRHGAVACAASAGLAANKAEAQQHVAAMARWATHEMGRSHDLGSMAGMGMGNMGSGTTTGHCVHNPDGSYTLQ